MKQFKGYDEAKKNAQFSGSEKLPAGAYVGKILAVKYETGKDGNSDMIKLQFDIAEGEYTGFFKNQYENNQNEDKKFKGQTTVYVPKDDGSEKDQWTMNTFAKWTNSFEESNPGYVWDWKEDKWKGLFIGLVYRDCGNVIDGKAVKYTEVAFPCSTVKVRAGNPPKARFKAKNGWTEEFQAAANKKSTSDDSNSGNDSDGFVSVPESSEEEFPFN